MTMTNSTSFPGGWPVDCPPSDAVDADGEVFRIVNNNPPISADLVSHHEAGKMPKAPPCLRCGLSVFRELRDVVHQRELFRNLGRWIAKGTLKPEHGKTKLTIGKRPTHTTWWVFDGVIREGIFAVIPENE